MFTDRKGRRRFVSRSSDEPTSSYKPPSTTDYGRRTSMPGSLVRDYKIGSTGGSSYVGRSNTFDNSTMSSPFTLQSSPSFDIGRPTSTRIGRSHSTDFTEYDTPSRRAENQSSDASCRSQPPYSPQYYPSSSTRSKYDQDDLRQSHYADTKSSRPSYTASRKYSDSIDTLGSKSYISGRKYSDTPSTTPYTSTRKYSDSGARDDVPSVSYHDDRQSDRLRDRTRTADEDRRDARSKVDEQSKSYRSEDVTIERRLSSRKNYSRRTPVVDSDSDEDMHMRHPPRRKGQRSPRVQRSKTMPVQSLGAVRQDTQYSRNLDVDSAYSGSHQVPERRSPVGGTFPSPSRRSPVGSKSASTVETSPSFHYTRSSKPATIGPFDKRDSADGKADSPSSGGHDLDGVFDSPRRMATKLSGRSKTAELGSILTATGADIKNGESNKENKPQEAAQDEVDARAERIAKYKAERRKQLASRYGSGSTSTDQGDIDLKPSRLRLSRRFGSSSDELKGEKPKFGGSDVTDSNKSRQCISKDDSNGLGPGESERVSGRLGEAMEEHAGRKSTSERSQLGFVSEVKKEPSDDATQSGATDKSAGPQPSTSSVSGSRVRARQRYIRRESTDSDRLDEKRQIADTIANDFAVLEAKMEARARRRREKAAARKSDLNKDDGRTSESSSVFSEDPKGRGVSPRTKTTPVTTEEYNQALDISEGPEITAILNRFSHRRLVEQKVSPDQERSPETETPPTAGKEDHIQKQIKLITAGNHDVSEKLKKHPTPDSETVTTPQAISSPKFSKRETASPIRTTPLKATTEEKLSPVRPSHLFMFSPAGGGAEPALKAEIFVPGGRLYTSKEEPIQASLERNLTKPVRRTSSLRDRSRPSKFSSDTSSSGPDDELSRILSRRKGTIENQIDKKLLSPKLDNLDTKWSPRNAKHVVNSDDGIQDEELKNVLKNRRARSESGERNNQPAVASTVEAVHPILKPEIPDAEKEPVPILRRKSPDEKQSVVKIQEPLPILRRKSLEGVVSPESVEPVPILRVKSLDVDDDTEEPVSILKNKEEALSAESAETLHSILKHKDDDGKRPSILKRRDFAEVEEVSWSDHKPSSILKKRDSADNTSSATSSPMRSRRSSGEDGKPASILKKRESEEFVERRSSEPELRMTSILKKRDSGDSEKIDSASSSRRGSCEEIRPISILKKRDSMSGDELEIHDDEDDVRPILKRRDRSQSPAEPHQSVLSPCRNPDDIDDQPRSGILKRPSLEESEALEHLTLQSIMKHKDDTDETASEPTHIFRKRHEKEPDTAALNLPEFLSQISDRSAKSESPVSKGRHSSLTDKQKATVTPKLGDASAAKSFDASSGSFQLHVADYSPAGRKQSGRPLYQKSHTFDSNELSAALKARRLEDDNSEQMSSSPRPLSAADEIKMIRAQAEENWEFPDEAVSVQSRIFQMQTKIEDDSSSPLRSRTGSGLVTPKLKLDSTKQSEIPLPKRTQPESSRISDEQLMAKLTDAALEPLIARRKQQKPRQRDWHSATMPVTDDEVSEANRLASVIDFRRQINAKSSKSIIKKLEAIPALRPGSRKEFPQHLSPKAKTINRRSSPRFKTQPITSDELSDIPESESFAAVLKIDVPSSSARGLSEGIKVKERLEIRTRSKPSTDNFRNSSYQTQAGPVISSVPVEPDWSVKSGSKSPNELSRNYSLNAQTEPVISSIPSVQVVNVDGANDGEIESLLQKSGSDSDRVLSDQEIHDIEAEFEKLFDLTEDEDKDVPPAEKDAEFENILTQAAEEIKKPMLTVDSFKKERSPRLGRERSPKRAGAIWKDGILQTDVTSHKDGEPQKVDELKKVDEPKRVGDSLKNGESQRDGVPQRSAGSRKHGRLQRDGRFRKDGESLKDSGSFKDGQPQKDGRLWKDSNSKDSVDGPRRASVDAKILPTCEQLPEVGVIGTSYQTEIKPKSLNLNLNAEMEEPRELVAWDRTAELEAFKPLPPTVIDLAETKEHHVDEKAKMSVFEKASLFAKGGSDEAPVRKIGAKRFIKKEKRERSRTQPITPDEVKQAALFNDKDDGSGSNSKTDSDDVTGSSSSGTDIEGKKQEVMQEIEEQKIKDDAKESDPLSKNFEDEHTTLSLAEKMKLFSERNQEKPPPKRDAPVTRRKTRRLQSRFATQPVTTEEVVQAAKISPLACSLIKPPDEGVLSGMPLSAQRDLAALHAETVLAESQAKAKASAAAKEKSEKSKEPTKADQNDKNLKPESKDQSKVRSILKREGSFERSRVGLNIRKKKPDQETITSSDEDQVKKGAPLGTSPLIIPKKAVEKPPTSSSDETAPVKCSNDAIARRRARKEQERFHTQPIESKSPETTPEKRKGKAMTARHMTQPITVGEKKVVEREHEEVDMSKMSISDRLRVLKTRGEEDWKKRVSKTDEDFQKPGVGDEVKRREKKDRNERPKSITDLIGSLEMSGEGWRGRVEEKDVKQFTVEGKLSASGRKRPTRESHSASPVMRLRKKMAPDSPLLARRNKRPKAGIVHLKNDSESSDTVSTPTPPVSPSKPSLPMMTITDNTMTAAAAAKTHTATNGDEDLSPKTIEIPAFDDTESFFTSKTEDTPGRTLEISDEALDDIFIYSQDILQNKKRIKPKRTRPTSRNPLRALAERKDIKMTYEEGVKSGIPEKEVARVKKEKIVGQQKGFDQSAIAGIAAKVNFADISLKKAAPTAASKTKGGLRVFPYMDIMLMQIKGRRQVQFRLVEPKAESLNSGDCFILVSSDKLFCWMGEFSNVIEKAKAQEIAQTIFQKKDLGFKGSSRGVITIDEARGQAHDAFWKLLDGVADYQDVGPDDEDLLYETFLTETNIVYRVEGSSLIPVEEFWGMPLRHEMLKSEEIYVLDFGTEMYVWHGKKVSTEKRKMAMKLAKQVWDQGYDYSELEISPLSPFKVIKQKPGEEDGGLPLKGDTRPKWCLLAKINENMETILFREKFKDWPDSNRIIKVKTGDSEPTKTDVALDLKPFDAKLMIPLKTNPVTLVLEGSNVGRGKKWIESFEGLKKEFDVITIKVLMWHVMEYETLQLHADSFGQFHGGDTYVVRWQYMINAGGLKNLKGQAARQSLTGRERCAYFFWQGRDSTINEKGASALMTVELDEERGPQVRVTQGREPACFLNLFDGGMILHIGKREDESTNTQGDWRLFAVRNEIDSEAYLMEVTCCIANLRSRSTFLLLNVLTGNLFVWHGAKSFDYTRNIALKIAQRLAKKCPLEVGLHKGAVIMMTEVEEGRERREFWSAMDSMDRSQYDCLMRDPLVFRHTPRLFYMDSVAGTFEVSEHLNPSRSDVCTPFPFLQADLYRVTQPALFLFDHETEVILWQGWWPEGDEESDNVSTGSARARFNLNRKCAMETTLHYCKEKNPSNPPPAYLVYAGLEPIHFTNLFPTWEVDEEAQEANLKDGRKEGLFRMKDILTMLSRTVYTFDELQERPLPDGVDASKIESYLSEEDFQEVLGMPKSEYYALPSWKQIELKKAACLF
ncbi:uncharacterized protein LOC135499312 isoform X9 [Lineus longissimus]|uniref:uncharacterized protein LOC135499312 isoform X9 n=1 Tax=Lineus longissimus TaxID=88925 RepID=UPI00315C5E79